MRSAAQRNGICLVLSLAILGSFHAVHADDQAPDGTQYRQEVRDRLKKLQSNLDLMLAAHQLTTDQYNAESQRVHQLRLQIHVDSQEQESMTQEDRNTDFQLIRQISREASQWAVANSSGAPVSPITP